MHDHNVAHMDLKPANILIPSAYGRLTIVDFWFVCPAQEKNATFSGLCGNKGICRT